MTKKIEPVLPFESSKPDDGSIESLANHLPLDDLARLIEINRGRICVFNQGTQTVDELSRYFSLSAGFFSSMSDFSLTFIFY